MGFIPEQKNIDLATGQLEIEVYRSDYLVDELCGFASRYNQARGYLFVSKVLGKHYPGRIPLMSRVHGQLAEKLLALNLEEPVVVIGLAETATGLGQGIFEACLDRQPSSKWVFLHTTRYALNHPIAFRVTEDHCHARDHLIYEPKSEEACALFRSAKTLVMIDDEISTGQTLLNVGANFSAIHPGLKRFVLATITSWLSPDSYAKLEADFNRPVQLVSLLDGSFKFTPKPLSPTKMPTFKSVGNWSAKDALLPGNYGRLGLCSSGYHRQALKEQMAKVRAGLSLERNRPVLVLGTGEFMHQPYLLARFLEEDGFTVTVQSTTRTPAMVADDINSALRFVDNYHDDIDNFLYNVLPDSDSQKIICYETARLPEGHTLAELLAAQTVSFNGK